MGGSGDGDEAIGGGARGGGAAARAAGALPAPLRASLERHQAHLADLVGSMQAAGLDETRIAACVRGLIDAYEVDLRQALREMGSGA